MRRTFLGVAPWAITVILLTTPLAAQPQPPVPPVAAAKKAAAKKAAAPLKIDGPKEAAPGSLVTLSAPAVEGAVFAWTAIPDNQNYRVDSNSSRLYFAAPAKEGTYNFVLAVARDKTVELLVHALAVAKPTDVIPPVKPVDPVDPVKLPPELENFAASVRDVAVELVPASKRQEGAAKYAANCDTVENLLQQGALGGRSAFVRFKELNAQLDEATREKWGPTFEKLTEKIQEFSDTNRLDDSAFVQALFHEMARGLRAVPSGGGGALRPRQW